MTKELKIYKEISAIPTPYLPDAIYLVRIGTGFNFYVSDTTGSAVFELNEKQSWEYLVANWSVEPTINTTIAGGEVYNYTLFGVTRYRFVPTTYDPTQDAFYSTFTSGTLSNLIVTRG